MRKQVRFLAVNRILPNTHQPIRLDTAPLPLQTSGAAAGLSAIRSWARCSDEMHAGMISHKIRQRAIKMAEHLLRYSKSWLIPPLTN
jgi:hypothetical protein